VGEGVGSLGTSCPDHFLRTRVCPLFLPWNPTTEHVSVLKERIHAEAVEYRAAYKKYYDAWGNSDSPKLRDSNPSVVAVPGLGLFGFGKNKKEARITTEFFINAIHVMAGANALEDGEVSHPLPQARHVEQSQQFTQFHNYVALPRSEAFRIEYWALEEAKLQRMPAEAEFSRKIALIIGGASASVAKSRCCSRGKELTSSSPILISKAPKELPMRLAPSHLPRSWHTSLSIWDHPRRSRTLPTSPPRSSAASMSSSTPLRSIPCPVLTENLPTRSGPRHSRSM